MQDLNQKEDIEVEEVDIYQGMFDELKLESVPVSFGTRIVANFQSEPNIYCDYDRCTSIISSVLFNTPKFGSSAWYLNVHAYLSTLRSILNAYQNVKSISVFITPPHMSIVDFEFKVQSRCFDIECFQLEEDKFVDALSCEESLIFSIIAEARSKDMLVFVDGSRSIELNRPGSDFDLMWPYKKDLNLAVLSVDTLIGDIVYPNLTFRRVGNSYKENNKTKVLSYDVLNEGKKWFCFDVQVRPHDKVVQRILYASIVRSVFKRDSSLKKFFMEFKSTNKNGNLKRCVDDVLYAQSMSIMYDALVKIASKFVVS